MSRRHPTPVVCLLLLLGVTTSQVEGLCSKFKCPEPFGRFSHPQTCLEYVKCLDGEAFVEKCPANLHWNENAGMCDKPEIAKCSEASKSSSKSCTLTRPKSLKKAAIPGYKCDCGKCCRKPNPFDCNKFFECDENTNAFSKSCSEGLVYNPVEEECDLPANYQCQERPLCKCKCRYPVDGECEAFYMCKEIGGVVSKEYCTEGLVFNSETKMCDFSANVECPALPRPTEEPGQCKDFEGDCKFWAANGDCVCDPFKNGDCSWQSYVKNNCPASCNSNGNCDNQEVTQKPSSGTQKPSSGNDCLASCTLGQYYPHPTDCTKFIQCAPYGPQEMPCGSGTRWDQSILTCNHASTTECVTAKYEDENGKDCSFENDGGDSESDGSDVTPPSNHPTTCKDIKSDCKYWAANGDCACDPFKNGDCSWQSYVKSNCPASCSTNGKCTDDGSNGNGESGSGSGGADSESGGSSNTINGCLIDCTLGHYYPHPTDCTKFIQCAPYGPQEMPCGPNTRWDQNRLICNHEAITACVTGTYKDENGNECGSGSGSGDNEGGNSGDGGSGDNGGSGSGDNGGSGSGDNGGSGSGDNGGSGSGNNGGSGSGESGSKESGSSESKESGSSESKESGSSESKESGSSESKESGSSESKESGSSESKESSSSESKESGSSESKESSSSESKESGEHGPHGSKESHESKESGGKNSNEQGNGNSDIIEGCVIECVLGKYYRHPSDCSKFIQCAPYGPAVMSCGPGTLWDQSILTCNHESTTECVTGTYSDEGGNSCGGKTDVEVTTPSEKCDIVCPQPNGEFSHPSNCKKWVHCSNSIARIKDCPAFLKFDPKTKSCNWPHKTTCISDLESDNCEVPIIPTTSPGNVVPPEVCDCECCLRPHPDDCQSYYYCDGPNTEFHSCPDGLVFHPANETCVFAKDYPECHVVAPPNCEDCECQFPSSVCSQYFKCVANDPIKMECPTGLHYNPVIRACDFPGNVDCAAPAPSLRRAPHVPRGIKAADCATLPEGRYASQADDRSFYHCANGVSFLLGCQHGSKFDAVLRKCIK